jgi:hypothetical protein
MLTNKYTHVKFTNMESYSTLQSSLLKHAAIAKPKQVPNKNDANGKTRKFVYYIDDLNVTNKCEQSNKLNRTFSLMRQVMETNYLYSFDDEFFHSFSEYNYVVLCSTPCECLTKYKTCSLGKRSFYFAATLSPDCHSLSESLTKNFICINMNPNMASVMESIYLPSIQHWLEEFPVDSLMHPIEMAEVSRLNGLFFKLQP